MDQPGVLKDEGDLSMGFTHLDEENMAEIKKLKHDIESFKKKHSLLLKDIDELDNGIGSSANLLVKLQENVDKQKTLISENEEELNKREQIHKENIRTMQMKNEELEAQTQSMKDKIDYFKRETENLKKICSSGMVKNMIFKGNVSNNMSGLNAKHQIQYPINGGSALITFQNPSVAAQIISDRDHTVSVEECWIRVKAEAVELPVLDALHMEMTLSSTKILVYNLPPGQSDEIIMDKLELFFGKTKNGGGEVEKREFLADCRCAILTFLDKEVASRLVAKKTFHVPFGDFNHKVFVAPSLEGNLKDYKLKKLECNRTVLITGIPDIMDTDALRDLLEIHFQKPSNGGGEVQELMYCPVGQHAVAIFEDDVDDMKLLE